MAQGGESVRIHSADIDALQTIRGVGPAVARNIVAFRETSGNICNLQELQQVCHAKIADEDAGVINYEENPDLNFSLQNQMDNLQLSPSFPESEVQTSLEPENGVHGSKEKIVPTTPSALSSQVVEMIDSKKRRKMWQRMLGQKPYHLAGLLCRRVQGLRVN